MYFHLQMTYRILCKSSLRYANLLDGLQTSARKDYRRLYYLHLLLEYTLFHSLHKLKSHTSKFLHYRGFRK